VAGQTVTITRQEHRLHLRFLRPRSRSDPVVVRSTSTSTPRRRPARGRRQPPTRGCRSPPGRVVPGMVRSRTQLRPTQPRRNALERSRLPAGPSRSLKRNTDVSLKGFTLSGIAVIAVRGSAWRQPRRSRSKAFYLSC
jgi:hypothetical protein